MTELVENILVKYFVKIVIGNRIRFLLKNYYTSEILHWHPENDSNLGIQFGFLLKFNLNVHIPSV